MMRRLKSMLERELHAANELSGKIHRLNQALLWYTIALGLLAARSVWGLDQGYRPMIAPRKERERLAEYLK